MMLALFVLAACQQPTIQEPTQSAIVKVEYLTYGGFTIAEENQQHIIWESDKTSYTISGYGSDSTFETINQTNQLKDIIPLLSGVSNWKNEYTSQVPIADVGVAEVRVTFQNGSTKTIIFNPNLPEEYPQENTLNTLAILRSHYYEIYRQTKPKYITFQPAQCETTPWQQWYEEGNINYITAPTDQQLITDFYASQGITISEVQRYDSELAVCEACGVCPTGYFYEAKVDVGIQIDGWE